VITLTIVLVNVAAYLFTAWRIGGQVAWRNCQYRYRRPSGDDWAGGILAGMFGALVWPISLPLSFGFEMSHGPLYRPKNIKEIHAAKEAEEREAAYKLRIRELERNCGISGHTP
jgi:hypothetical protein